MPNFRRLRHRSLAVAMGHGTGRSRCRGSRPCLRVLRAVDAALLLLLLALWAALCLLLWVLSAVAVVVLLLVLLVLLLLLLLLLVLLLLLAVSDVGKGGYRTGPSPGASAAPPCLPGDESSVAWWSSGLASDVPGIAGTARPITDQGNEEDHEQAEERDRREPTQLL